LVASVHVLVGSQEDYVTISRDIRRALHRCGIHSSTIQPEILGSPGAVSRASLSKGLVPPDLVPIASSAAIDGSGDGVVMVKDIAGCLVQCEEDCGGKRVVHPEPVPLRATPGV